MKLPFELHGGLLLSANTFLILCLAFPVQVLVSRYLGPEQLGEYAYVLAFAFIARVLVNLNLRDSLIPLYKRKPDDALYSTGWLLSKTVAILLVLATSSVALLLSKLAYPEATLAWQTVIVFTGFLLCDSEIYGVWCKCEGEYKDLVRIELGGTIVGLLIRVALITAEASITAFLWSYVFEQGAKFAIAACHYLVKKRTFFSPSRVNVRTAKVILASTWPICLSALLGVAQSRCDQLLLGSLLEDSNELGFYSVAARLIECLTYAAVALFIVYLPILSKSDRKDTDLQLQRLHDLVIWGLALAVVPLYFALGPLVSLLYGAKFQPVAVLVTVYLLALPPLCLSYSRAAFMYSQGLQRLELTIRVFAVLANISLNFWLIPDHGAMGAVWATIMVQWISSVGLTFAIPSLRPVALALLRATYLPKSGLRLVRWVRAESRG